MARSTAHDDDVLVIGLGRFGAAAALELRRLGHKVTAIEKDGFLAEKFLGRVSHVIHGDASDVAVIRDAKAGRFRIAVVAIGYTVAVLSLVDQESALVLEAGRTLGDARPGFPYTQIDIPRKDAARQFAWVMTAPAGAGAWVLYLHGNASTIASPVKALRVVPSTRVPSGKRTCIAIGVPRSSAGTFHRTW